MKLLYTLSLLIAIHTPAPSRLHAQQPTLPELTHAIATADTARQVELHQQALIKTVKKTKRIARNEYCAIIEALEKNDGIPFLAHNKTTIALALQSLHGISGFFPTLARLVKASPYYHYAKGPLFEIEVALHIHQDKPNETVHALNEQKRAPHDRLQREFDIITSHHWIECKDCNWELFCNEQQLLDQQHIVKQYNSNRIHPITYLLYSKHPLPDKQHDWCTQHNIAVRIYEHENEYS